MRSWCVVGSALLALAGPALGEEPSTTGGAFWGEPTVDGGRCCRTLGEVRQNIDRIDRELVRLMAERGRYVHVARVRGAAGEQNLSPEVAEATYRAMVGAFTAYEQGVSAAAQATTPPQGKQGK